MLSQLEKLFEDGLEALRKERFNQACDLFAEAMEIDPQMPQIHYNMGLAAGHLYRWQEALECFRMALRIQPHADSWVHLGLVYLHLRNWGEARKSLERALEMEPKSEVALTHHQDLLDFLALEQVVDFGCPSLCTDWYDPRLQSYVGVDPEIILKAKRRELRAFLAPQLGADAEGECDHTHALTEEWALRNGLDPLGVSRFLYSRGMPCDCQVLAEPDE